VSARAADANAIAAAPKASATVAFEAMPTLPLLLSLAPVCLYTAIE
jgi:hypothetical protein